jgi:hypothetical protein
MTNNPTKNNIAPGGAYEMLLDAGKNFAAQFIVPLIPLRKSNTPPRTQITPKIKPDME